MGVTIKKQPFSCLFLGYSIGYFDAEGNAQICTDRNIAADFDETTVLLQGSSSFFKTIKDVEDITVAPVLCMGKGKVCYYATPKQCLKDRDFSVAEDSEYVTAPYQPELPLTLSCRIKERDSWSIKADIINIMADPSIVDEKGELDLKAFFSDFEFVQVGS